MPKQTVNADGSFDWSSGVDSQAVTTIKSALVPHGLGRDQLSWASNATMRGGGILQRNGLIFLVDAIQTGLYQGGWMYEHPDGVTHPYLVFQVQGVIYKLLCDPPYTLTNLSARFATKTDNCTNNPTQDMAFFAEGNGYLVIQSGDGVTLPLFYSAAQGGNPEFLRRSHGITGQTTGPLINEIPASGPMVYYSGRIWYSQNRQWTAGDIEGNQASGTVSNNFLDSILRVTENPLATGGDGFIVPSQAGPIRAMAYTANLDTALGQGPLYIFTAKQVYAMQVPITRTAWIAADTNTQPLVTVAQINNGAVGDRCVVHVNGDLFYQSFDPAIRSLIVATRYFQQWGNVAISNNETRALGFNDRSILRFATGIQFDNRLLMGILPKQTDRGVACQAIAPLDFDLISTLQDRLPPAWEGVWEGLDILQMFTGDFGGLPRAFALVVSRLDKSIDLFEITTTSRTDYSATPGDTDHRVGWFLEFPAFNWGKEFELKWLQGGEIWVDKIFGPVNLEVYYRPDADPCWYFWHQERLCATRVCAEDMNNPVCYPTSPNYREAWKWTITLPEPPEPKAQSNSSRPADVGYQFQVKLVIKGWMRIRGLILYAADKEKQIFEGLEEA